MLLAGLGPLGLPELAIVLVIVVLIFGVGRLPEVGGAIGKGIREFRHATKDDEGADTTSEASTDAATATTEVTTFDYDCRARSRGAGSTGIGHDLLC